MSYLAIFCLQFLTFAILHLFFFTDKAKILLSQTKNYKILVVLLFVIELIFIVLINMEVGDVFLRSSAGWHLRHKIDFYFIDQGHGSYPYFPFLIFFDAAANKLNEIIPWFNYSQYLKLLELVCLNVVGFIIVRKTIKSDGFQRARVLQFQFLTSPIVYATIIFHGQTDIILLALFFLCTHFLLLPKQNLPRFFASVLFFAASIGVKTWSIIFFPIIATKLKNFPRIVLFTSLTGLLLLIDVFIYTRIVDGSSIRTVLPAVLKAGGPTGIWGMTYLLWPFKALIGRFNLLFFACLFAVSQILILRKKMSFWLTCFLTVLGVYIILPNWGVQYLLWIVPFMFIVKKVLKTSHFVVFTILACVYAFFNYTNIAYGKVLVDLRFINVWGLCLWLFCIYWFGIILFRSKVQPHLP